MYELKFEDRALYECFNPNDAAGNFERALGEVMKSYSPQGRLNVRTIDHYVENILGYLCIFHNNADKLELYYIDKPPFTNLHFRLSTEDEVRAEKIKKDLESVIIDHFWPD